jgi:type II secretory pathway component PulM
MTDRDVRFIQAAGIITILALVFLLGYLRLEDRITHVEDRIRVVEQQQAPPLP